MKYTCDDFKELKFKQGENCSVGMFGKDIYAMRFWVAIGHNVYYSEYFKIEKEEFDNYPFNSEILIEKYYHSDIPFLCSDYQDKSHPTYGFEV